MYKLGQGTLKYFLYHGNSIRVNCRRFMMRGTVVIAVVVDNGYRGKVLELEQDSWDEWGII